MLQQITWENLNTSLFEEFPILRDDRYASIIGGLEGWNPGQYVVFGSPFVHYIRDLVTGPADPRAKVGKFLERMATTDIGKIEELLTIEVLPTFLESQEALDAFWPALGGKTRQILCLIAPKKGPQINIPTGL